jgi:hypothetical protein
VIDRIEAMLRRCDGDQRVMPPTHLYNEGWLLRAAIDWLADHPLVDHALAVPDGTRWYSEALLPSQFLPRRHGDPLAESYTHADGAIGDFDIGNSGEGDLALRPDARRFVVVEAKLHSKLSSGTKNAPGYDQAARNVACLAHVLSLAPRRPDEMATLGFFVVAPASQIQDHVFDAQLSKDGIREKVSKRVAAYQDTDMGEWFDQWFLPTLQRTRIAPLSWEELGAFITKHDAAAGQSFLEFYSRCLQYNRLAERGPRG